VSPEIESPAGPSWDYNDLVLFVFLAMLSIGATQLITTAANRALHIDKADRALTQMPSQVLLYGLLIGVLYGVLKMQFGRPFLPAIAWVDFPFSGMTAIMFGAILAVLNVVLAQLLHTPEVDTPIKHLLARRITALEFGIIGSTIGPLCEELVFRGFMQPVFVRTLGPALGILVTAVCFGALHLAQNGFAWQSGALITIAGISFGWMRQASGSTKASTLMHSAYNFTIFLPVFFQTGTIANK
jgi:membrane protease YdiL (CAAX protease family)